MIEWDRSMRVLYHVQHLTVDTLPILYSTLLSLLLPTSSSAYQNNSLSRSLTTTTARDVQPFHAPSLAHHTNTLLFSPTAAGPSRQSRFMSTSAALSNASTQVPDFSSYTKGQTETAGRAYSYFVVGSMGLITAAGAKSTVSDFLTNMSASSDVLALAKVEVDISAIPEGKNVIIKWRGKPVFIRHRTAGEIDEANEVDVSTLRDPETDADRTKKPEW